MVAAERLSDASRVWKLVQVPVLDEADGKRLDGAVTGLRHEGDDQARVEPAREHRSERHVAHQPQPHGLPRCSSSSSA